MNTFHVSSEFLTTWRKRFADLWVNFMIFDLLAFLTSFSWSFISLAGITDEKCTWTSLGKTLTVRRQSSILLGKRFQRFKIHFSKRACYEHALFLSSYPVFRCPHRCPSKVNFCWFPYIVINRNKQRRPRKSFPCNWLTNQAFLKVRKDRYLMNFLNLVPQVRILQGAPLFFLTNQIVRERPWHYFASRCHRPWQNRDKTSVPSRVSRSDYREFQLRPSGSRDSGGHTFESLIHRNALTAWIPCKDQRPFGRVWWQRYA